MKASTLEHTEQILTGTLLDRLVGGIPKNRLMEIAGNESIGKTTLCLQALAHMQQEGYTCAWAAVEEFDARYARSLGVDLDNLEVITGAYGEAVLDAFMEAFESKGYDVIFLDSIGALTPKAELEKGFEEVVMAGQSRMVSRLCRKLAPSFLMGNQTAVVIINHTKLDFETGQTISAGGKPLRYHKSVAIHLKWSKWIKSGDKIVGKQITAEAVKDKVRGQEKNKVVVDLIFKEGFSATSDLLELALIKDVITKGERGRYFYKGEQVAYGDPKMRKWLEEHQEEVKNAIV